MSLLLALRRQELCSAPRKASLLPSMVGHAAARVLPVCGIVMRVRLRLRQAKPHAGQVRTHLDFALGRYLILLLLHCGLKDAGAQDLQGPLLVPCLEGTRSSHGWAQAGV